MRIRAEAPSGRLGTLIWRRRENKMGRLMDDESVGNRCRIRPISAQHPRRPMLLHRRLVRTCLWSLKMMTRRRACRSSSFSRTRQQTKDSAPIPLSLHPHRIRRTQRPRKGGVLNSCIRIPRSLWALRHPAVFPPRHDHRLPHLRALPRILHLRLTKRVNGALVLSPLLGLHGVSDG